MKELKDQRKENEEVNSKLDRVLTQVEDNNKEDSPVNIRLAALEIQTNTDTPLHSHTVRRTGSLSADSRFKTRIEGIIKGKVPYEEENGLWCPPDLILPFWGFVKTRAADYTTLPNAEAYDQAIPTFAEYKRKILRLDEEDQEKLALGAAWLKYLKKTYWECHQCHKVATNSSLQSVETMDYDERMVEHGLTETFRKIKASIKNSMGTRSAKQAESTKRCNEKRRQQKLGINSTPSPVESSLNFV